MNWRPVLGILGRLLLLLSLSQFVPVAVCLIYGESGAARAFAASAGICALCGDRKSVV